MPHWRIFIILSRPGNAAITALSVITAGVICREDWRLAGGDLATAAISAALMAAGGNAYNDYCDRDLDRRQKPQRPIPSGKITPRAALLWAACCFISGTLAGAAIGMAALGICILAALLLIVYSRFLKETVLWGNFVVAFVAALSFIYGGITVRSASAAIWAAGLAFLFHLGREVIKDLEDREGDARAGAKTLPVIYGLVWARCAVTLIFLLLAILLPLPYYMGEYRAAYLIMVLAGVLPALLAAIILSWTWSQPRQLHYLSIGLKWDMLIGIIALYIGRPWAMPA